MTYPVFSEKLIGHTIYGDDITTYPQLRRETTLLVHPSTRGLR